MAGDACVRGFSRDDTARPAAIDRFVSPTRRRRSFGEGELASRVGEGGVSISSPRGRGRPRAGRGGRTAASVEIHRPRPVRVGRGTRVLQTGVWRRGGWNTSFPRRSGRGVLVFAERKERAVETSTGIDAHQAQDPSRPSNVPAGTGGVAGCPEHQAPRQGRGPRGTETGSDWPARSRIKGSTSDESRRGSSLEVTRCEQPAFATGGARKTSARSVATAPAGEKVRCQGGRDLVICWVLWNGSPSRSEGGNILGR
jgi:hypothetical protein